LWPHFTVKENIAFGLKEGKEKNIAGRIAELLDLFGIGDKAGKYPHQLSGGQKQMVAIARSIAMKPDILLMDEPLANIDTHVKQSILEHVNQLQKRLNFTMIYVTHNHREAFKTGDIILVMNNGKIVLQGTKDEIVNSTDSFIKSFLEN
jgi:ABC-type Fe3+/spermidine/putrescine transport system ATPase subunit